jgi:hypothetical protein
MISFSLNKGKIKKDFPDAPHHLTGRAGRDELTRSRKQGKDTQSRCSVTQGHKTSLIQPEFIGRHILHILIQPYHPVEEP